MNYIYAIKIHLDKFYSTIDSIGLYSIGGKSYLKWCELPLVGVETTGTWKSGILSALSSISYTADCATKGAVVNAGNYTVDVFNTDQLSLKLFELGIHLNGLKCERFLFVGTDTDSDYISGLAISSGIIELSNGMAWDETNMSFNVKTGTHKRNANICTPANDNKKMIPVTYGASDPANGIYFKALRSVSEVTILKQEDMVTGGIEGTDYFPGSMELFPISNPRYNIEYDIRLGYITSEYVPADNYFIGKYVLVKEGTGEGVYRQISDAEVTYTGDTVVDVVLKDYVPENFVGNYDGNATDQTWVQLIDIEREFKIDDELCLGFCDQSGNVLTKEAYLYSINNDTVFLLPSYGYDIDALNTDKNTVVINPRLFDGSPDTMLSFYIAPVTEFELYDEPDMSDWSTPTETLWSSFTKNQTGIYQNGTIDTVSPVAIGGTAANLSDKKIDTFYEFSYNVTQDILSSVVYYFKVFRFKLPQWPEGITANKVYIGLKLWSRCTCAEYVSPGPVIMTRGFISRHTKVLEGKKLAERYAVGGDDGANITNLPDDYWTPPLNYKNEDFYRVTLPDGSGEYLKISSYETIDLGVTTKAEYDAIYECVIALYRKLINGESHNDETRIYQLVVMFESSAEIKEVIYV